MIWYFTAQVLLFKSPSYFSTLGLAVSPSSLGRGTVGVDQTGGAETWGLVNTGGRVQGLFFGLFDDTRKSFLTVSLEIIMGAHK